MYLADSAEGIAARRQPLRAKNLAALGAAGVQNPAATLGRHAGAETMAAGAHQVRRLESAFHLSYSGISVRRREVWA